MSATTLNTAALLSFASSFSEFIDSLDWDRLEDNQLSKLESATQQAADLVLEACIDAGQDLPEHRRLFELDNHLFDEMTLRHEVRDYEWNFAEMHEARYAMDPEQLCKELRQA